MGRPDAVVDPLQVRREAGSGGLGMKRFVLQRDEDETGISGTGLVCEGVEFPDGTVAMHWLVGEYRSTVVWDAAQGMEAVEAIHGHNGRTRVVWLDTDHQDG
jgi:hypothetical protein